MSGLKRRLSRLEGKATLGGPPKVEREKIREQAEHANRCRARGEPPVFEITETGDVLCAHDGRPVTDTRQILAEQFYWMEVEWCASPGLVHDEEAQAFYAPDGGLALSRDRVDLPRLMGP